MVKVARRGALVRATPTRVTDPNVSGLEAFSLGHELGAGRPLGRVRAVVQRLPHAAGFVPGEFNGVGLPRRGQRLEDVLEAVVGDATLGADFPVGSSLRAVQFQELHAE